MFSISEANGIFEKELYPYLVSMALEQGALALVFAGDTEHEFKMSDALATAMKNSTGRMADQFNNDTMDALVNTLTEGVQAGESLGKLTNRVEDVYSSASGYRAERIARTETQSASGDATIEAYKQTGYVVSKRWFANPGACEFCQALDGQEVGLEESFVDKGDSITGVDGGTYEVTYDNVEAADAHPNCTCTIVPVRE